MEETCIDNMDFHVFNIVSQTFFNTKHLDIISSCSEEVSMINENLKDFLVFEQEQIQIKKF